MKKLLEIFPAIILTVYITAGNMTGFRLSFVRPLSLSGLIFMALILFLRRKKNGLSAIDKGFFVYFTVNAVVFWVFPQNLADIAAAFPTGLLYTILFILTAFPALFMRRYFTEHFAKKSTPQAVWQTNIFKTINRNMTWAWAGIFALSAFITVVPWLFSMPASLLAGLVFQVMLPALIMLGIGLPLNRRYPLYYQRKMGIEPVHEIGKENIKKPAPYIGAEETTRKEEHMTDSLKVVAINGSPHGAIGNTSQMIQMIASVLSQEGIAVEEVFLSGKRIEYCIGCGVCLEKTRCWRQDDHAEIVDKLLTAQGIILASPVYFKHVTAQMKTFFDRSLSLGHKPRKSYKPGLAITVSAGLGDSTTAKYLEGVLRVYGAFSAGAIVAIATSPGGFLGKELVEARAADLGRDLARAIKEQRQYPATGEELSFYLFMRDLVTREKDFMRGDYQHWQEAGLLDGFEAYAGQSFTVPPFDPALRKEWLKNIITEEVDKDKEREAPDEVSPGHVAGPASAKSCLELLRMMPMGFKGQAGKDLSAVYQFDITGSEEFTAHLRIADGKCTFLEGPHERPDVVIKSPADVWLAISRGEMDGQSAFMSGKYRVEGNIALLLNLKSLFGG
ncbi:MAG: NAD(P)H-dependent oxidoreductase [Proteobacteria bacterium]|nr:NAD(P)H-dependent oxidoreductase [Pseudomonadota bacterium]